MEMMANSFLSLLTLAAAWLARNPSLSSKTKLCHHHHHLRHCRLHHNHHLQSERDDAEVNESIGAFHNRLMDLDKLKHQGPSGELELELEN